MHITTLQDARLLAWLNRKLGLELVPSQCSWVAGLDASGPIFVVAYSRFSRRSCELTIATDGTRRWATRRTLRAIFEQPFRVWDMRRVNFIVAADNRVSVDMVERLGAQIEGRVRCAFPGDVDGLVMGMLKEECRWVT